MKGMTRQETLAWQKGFEAAREAERSLTRREPVDVARSIRLALALIETCRRQGILSGSGLEAEREHALAAVRERWTKLKEASHS